MLNWKSYYLGNDLLQSIKVNVKQVSKQHSEFMPSHPNVVNFFRGCKLKNGNLKGENNLATCSFDSSKKRQKGSTKSNYLLQKSVKLLVQLNHKTRDLFHFKGAIELKLKTTSVSVGERMFGEKY